MPNKKKKPNLSVFYTFSIILILLLVLGVIILGWNASDKASLSSLGNIENKYPNETCSIKCDLMSEGYPYDYVFVYKDLFIKSIFELIFVSTILAFAIGLVYRKNWGRIGLIVSCVVFIVVELQDFLIFGKFSRLISIVLAGALGAYLFFNKKIINIF